MSRTTLRVTRAQVEAAKLLVQRDEARGRLPRRGVQRIADADQAGSRRLPPKAGRRLGRTHQGPDPTAQDLLATFNERQRQQLEQSEPVTLDPMDPLDL